MLVKSILAFLLLYVAFSQLPPCREVYYDHNAFALSWPKEFCSQKACIPGWDQNWDGKSFTIHGFWPSSTDLAYLSCFREHKIDPYCNREFEFDQSLLSDQDIADMEKYWPQNGQNIPEFWNYQWSKHGVCYLKIYKEDYGLSDSEESLFKLYFESTIQKYKALNFNISSGTFKSKATFAKKLGLNSSQFIPICGRDNELDEIRVCYSISEEPGKEQLIDCPPSTDRNICKFPIILK